MTYVPETSYELPDPGEHLAVLVDEFDIGMVPAMPIPGEKQKPPRHTNRLIFALDQNDSFGRPFLVRRDLHLTRSRHPSALLHQFIAAFISPNPITDADWDTSRHIGKQIRVTIKHKVKESGTWANVAGDVFAVAKGDKHLLQIPADYDRNDWLPKTPYPPYVPKSTAAVAAADHEPSDPDDFDADVSFPGNEKKPAQSAVTVGRPSRVKGEPFATGVQESPQPPLL